MTTDDRSRVKMKVKSAGITDEQVIEYTWTDNKASWTLISAPQRIEVARCVATR